MWLSRTILWLLLGEQAAMAAVLPPGFTPVHQSESYLSNIQIDPGSFRKLLLWDDRSQEWRVMQAGEAPGERAPVLVLHLWADYCEPCRKEFPLLRDLAEQITARHGEQVRFVYISATDSSAAMGAFMQKYQAHMPKGPHYQDTGEIIAASLRQALPDSLSLPVTLVLDEQRIVRLAVVGSLARRRRELTDAIDRIVNTLKRSPAGDAIPR